MLKKKSASSAFELALAKLESSGLSEKDMQVLRMEALEPEETKKLHETFRPIAALKIPYFDPRDLSKPLSAKAKWPPFYRLRYLRPGGDAKDDVRYTNEPGSGVVGYFPPSVDWPRIIQDPEQTLLLTEGELKAAKACSMGFPCIGLGGVWNFRSTQMGISFLPELDAINWVRRRVYIVYDSDIIVKPGVQDALNAIAEELMQRGALSFIVLVPEGDDGKKQGLDDWCVANPTLDIYDLCARHQPLTQVRKLFDFNEKFCYVLDKGLILVQNSGDKMSSSHFKEAFQNVDYSELVITEKGSISLKKAQIALNWLKWPMRRQVASMTYKPGQPKFIDYDDKDKALFNLWPGWAVKPEKGDVQPFLDLLDHLFQGADVEDKKWFLKWMAYPLQFPGTKLFTAAVLHGVRHGTGKSLIGYTLGAIYGKNFTEINQNHLHAGFNAWAEAKQLVMGDDVTGSNKRQDNDLLKKLITQRELRVNIKFVPEYVVPDCVNYLFTSNHPDAFFLENDDRRFFIHEVLVKPLEEAFYLDYMLWLDTTGPAALFHYLLNLDLGDFNPSAPARRTVAKDQMTADTRSDLGDWVHKLRVDPDSVLKVGNVQAQGDMFTAAELLLFYDPSDSKKVTANGLARELRRAAVARANRGVAFKGPKGTERYYIVRNIEKWVDASAAKLSQYLEKLHGSKK